MWILLCFWSVINTARAPWIHIQRALIEVIHQVAEPFVWGGRALQAGDVSAKDVARGLQRVLASGLHAPELQQYAQLALHSPEPSLRELAVQQTGRAIQVLLHVGDHDDGDATFGTMSGSVSQSQSVHLLRLER